jgi:hypothetical protein
MQGLALRVRWEWLQRTDPSRPWQGVQMPKDKEDSQLFDSMVKIKVGDGRSTLFWRDRWLNARSVADYATGLVRTINKRVQNSRTAAFALVDNR